jgi:hypothetical protein
MLSRAVMLGLVASAVMLPRDLPQNSPREARLQRSAQLTSTPPATARPGKSEPFVAAPEAPTQPDIRARAVTTVRIGVEPQRPNAAPVSPGSVRAAQAQVVVEVSTPTSTPVEPVVPPVLAPTAPAAPPAGWTEAEITAAVSQCATTLAGHNVRSEPVAAMRQGVCGTPAPISLRAVGKSYVSLQTPAVMNCAVAAALSGWVDRVLQPAASDIFKSPVVRLLGTGSYACRNRNGAADGPISEHAFANAFDIGGFELADGRTINVLNGWGQVARDLAPAGKGAVSKVAVAAKPVLAPDSRSALKGPPVLAATTGDQPATPTLSSDAKFLRRIHAEACSLFGTVLGPEANDAHRNHLHLDLKVRKGKAYCQ